MPRKTIKILTHEDKTAKNGKDYTKFDTTEGPVTCFESDVIEKVKQCEKENVACEVEIKESGDFKNLREFYKKAKEAQQKGLKESSEKPQGEKQDKGPQNAGMEKCAALKQAVAFVTELTSPSSAEGLAESKKEVIRTADMFLNWLENGDDSDGS